MNGLTELGKQGTADQAWRATRACWRGAMCRPFILKGRVLSQEEQQHQHQQQQDLQGNGTTVYLNFLRCWCQEAVTVPPLHHPQHLCMPICCCWRSPSSELAPCQPFDSPSCLGRGCCPSCCAAVLSCGPQRGCFVGASDCMPAMCGETSA